MRLDRLLLKENSLLGGYSNNGEGSDIDVHGKRYRGLPSKSFTNFDRINYTSLEGSPIRSIGPAAFRYNKINHFWLNIFMSIGYLKWMFIYFKLYFIVNPKFDI